MTLFTETLPPADQPYAVPENWVWMTLKQINTRISKTVDPTKRLHETFELYSVPSFDEYIPEFLTGEDIKSSKQAVAEGDILLCKINPRINRVWIVGNFSAHQKIASSEWIVIRTSHVVYNHYLLWCLRGHDFRHLFTSQVAGVGGSLMRARPKDVIDYPIPIPPFPEQRRIASKLDALLGKLREARALIDEARESFALRRAAILHQAFSGKLTAHWRAEHRQSESKKVKLNEVSLTIKIGPFGSMLHKADYITGGIPLINPAHIKGQKITSDLDFTVSQEKCIELSEYVLAENDIIMGRRGEMGRCALITKIEHGWLCGTGSLFIRPDKVIHPQYLFYALNSNDVKSYLKASSQGSTMDNLNLKIIKNIEIPLPPLEEQREIVRQLDSLLGHETDAAALLDMDDELDLLEQSILSRAFRGELGTNDPAEPPAI